MVDRYIYASDSGVNLLVYPLIKLVFTSGTLVRAPGGFMLTWAWRWITICICQQCENLPPPPLLWIQNYSKIFENEYLPLGAISWAPVWPSSTFSTTLHSFALWMILDQFWFIIQGGPLTMDSPPDLCENKRKGIFLGENLYKVCPSCVKLGLLERQFLKQRLGHMIMLNIKQEANFWFEMVCFITLDFWPTSRWTSQ